LNKKILIAGLLVSVMFFFPINSAYSNISIQKDNNFIIPINSGNILDVGGSSDKTGVTIYINGCCEGYTFLNIRDKVGGGLYTSMIDMNGTQVKSWQIDSLPAKMLPEGKIIGGDYLREGYYNRCKNITEINWDGEVLWSFSKWDNDSG